MRDPIDNLRVATPCEASWSAMAGDERVRHCTLCDLNVYNFAELTRDEIRALIARSEGRLCGRLYRRADGTVITRDCPTGLAALRQRRSRFANAGLGALLSMWAFATGCATTGRTHKSRIELQSETSATPRQAIFTGVVQFDNSPLPGATISLRDEVTHQETTAVTDVHGAFTVNDVADGTYRVEVGMGGWQPAIASHVRLARNQLTRAHVALQLPPAETIIVGAIAAPGPLDSSTISTTFYKDLIDKLP